MLKVTPQITAANTVIMQIAVENASADFPAPSTASRRSTRNAPTPRCSSATAQTTVIGGIYANQERATTIERPALSRIPLLGWLFKRDTLNDRARSC